MAGDVWGMVGTWHEHNIPVRKKSKGKAVPVTGREGP
jgi:hypothetical protein